MLMSKGYIRAFSTKRIDTKMLSRTFTDMNEALQFYELNTDLAVGQLEPILSQLAYIQGIQRIPAETLFSDERLIRLILQISSEIESCETSKLVRLSVALSKLSVPREGASELAELARKIGEITPKRVNSFSPSDLADLCLGLSSRGYSDPVFVDFVCMEVMKMVQDFTPGSAIMMLEAFRRMGVFRREVVDNLVERLTDEVDKFTSKDIVNCVVVFSKLGLGRGYLLRRISKLSFENLNLFNQVQLVRLLTGFSKLRFISTTGLDELLNAIESHGIQKMTPNLLSDCMFATALGGYRGESMVLNRLVEAYEGVWDSASISSMLDFAWSLCVLDETGRYQNLLDAVTQKIFSIAPPSNRELLLKALEVVPCVDASIVSTQWRSAMDDAEKLDMARFESARLHTEMLSLIESLTPQGQIKEKLNIQRNAQVGGLFRVDFFDEKQQLVVDLDTLSRPAGLVMRHRLLSQQGIATAKVGYWEVRRLKSFDEQQAFLRTIISRAIRNRNEP
jgi:hypothetical protein